MSVGVGSAYTVTGVRATSRTAGSRWRGGNVRLITMAGSWARFQVRSGGLGDGENAMNESIHMRSTLGSGAPASVAVPSTSGVVEVVKWSGEESVAWDREGKGMGYRRGAAGGSSPSNGVLSVVKDDGEEAWIDHAGLGFPMPGRSVQSDCRTVRE